MRPVEEALAAILEAVGPLAPIELPLLEAHGCVLATEIVAEYDVPPFSAAGADGFAARSADVSAPPATLRVTGAAPAGRPPELTVGWGEAVAVPAGAPLPAGADCVIPRDASELEGDRLHVAESLEAGAFVLPAGRDLRAGEVLVPAGRRLAAPELAVLASAGHAAPATYPKVRVAVLSVGELVEPGRPTALGQVRDAGSFAVVGALRDLGAVPYRVGILPADAAELREAVLTNLARADAFVVTAGSSDEDLSADLFGGLGIELTEVAMYPGMIHGFGLFEGTPFFVLSGAPASTFVSFEVLVRPAMLRMMGRRDPGRPEVEAVADEEVSGPSELTLFVPARVGKREGEWHVTPMGPADPSLLHGLARANGLIVIPPGDRATAAGERVSVRIFRPLDR